MRWEVCQVCQLPPVEPGEIDVVGMAHGDGHLMPRLPAAKQAGLGFLDGGDAGSGSRLPVAQMQFVELGGVAMHLEPGDKTGHVR